MSGSSAEESEEEINQSLQDLGLLEAGMTSVDKRNLWSVIKISKDTAQAEEQDRRNRAKQNLQFDEVSSRTEVSSGTQLNSDAQNEKNNRLSTEEASDTDEEIIEVQKKPTVAAVTPLCRDNPSQRTATVHPICHSEDHNEDLAVTVSDSSSQNIERTESQSLLQLIPRPAARRGLRSKPYTEQSPSKTNSTSLSVNVSSNIADTLALSSVSERQAERDMKDCESSVPPTDNSEPCSSSVKQDGNISDALSNSELSPLRKLQSSLTFTPFNKQSDKNCTENESRKSDSDNNCSALDKEIEDINKEKSDGNGNGDNVPSPSTDSLLNEVPSSQVVQPVEVTKQSEDKERNIDVFNCDRSNYEWTLKVRRVKRACSRLPFYIPPHKMDIHTYIAYFKKCINEQAAQLLEVQRRNYKYIPWGDPVVVGESIEEGEQKNENLATLQRYNFRERKVAHYKETVSYEDADTQNEEDGDDMFVDEKKPESSDDLFDSLLESKKNSQTSQKEPGSPSSTCSVVERQGPMKRKSDSSDDKVIDLADKSSEPEEKRMMPSAWLSKRETASTSLKRKKLGPVMFNDAPAHNWKDLDMDLADEDFEPSRKNLRRRGRGSKSSVSKRNIKRKPPLQIKTSKQNGGIDDDDIFAEMDAAEGVTENASVRQETDIIRPAPVKLRKQGRNRVQRNKQEDNTQTEPAQVDDIAVVYDASASSNKEDTEQVPCPICSKKFPAKNIEEHASECNEYCQEVIREEEEEAYLHVTSPSSPEEVVEQSPSHISEECWSQFENGQHVGDMNEDEPQQQCSVTLRSHTRQDELEAPMSPIRCFVPISAQQDSEIDYHHQFRVAPRLNLRRKPVRKRRRGRKRKRKQSNKKGPPVKRKKTTPSLQKKLEDVW